MTAIKGLSILAGAALLVFGAASAAPAQPPAKGQPAGRTYNVQTETTITGTIESVEAIAAPGGRGRRGLGGTHVMMKTEKETLAVHVGPTAYLAEKGIVLAKGDSVEITGSRVTIDEDPVVIARQIKKGDKTWTLRDATGRPMWSRSR